MTVPRTLPAAPSDAQIAQWVVDTCTLFGTSALTAHKVAVLFVERLEIDRASTPPQRDAFGRPLRIVDWTTFVRDAGHSRGVGRVSLSCGHDVPTNEAHIRSRRAAVWCEHCFRNVHDCAVCDDIGADCPDHGRQTL